MPIYEYRCTACQHKLEAIQKFSDAPLVACPQCGKDTLTKLVSAAGFQLKGSGWYQTDFKGSGSKAPVTTPTSSGGESKPADGAAAKSPDASSAKSDAKSDAAPAASAPATPATPSTP